MESVADTFLSARKYLPYIGGRSQALDSTHLVDSGHYIVSKQNIRLLA